MRLLSVAQIKRKLKGRKCRALQPKPVEGSVMRAVYDELMNSMGKPVELFKGKDKITAGSIHQALNKLKLYYGLDIRLIRHGSTYQTTLHCLVGEWFGSIYIDYTAETEEQMDLIAEARYALQHTERVENILPAGVNRLSKESIEILERVAAKGRELAAKHLKRGS